jgi:hypothetical protein
MAIVLNGTTGISTPNVASDTSTLGPLTQALNLGSTGQIVFPATQNASSNANTLDDYEEGTWTPTVFFGGASVGTTYAAKTFGRYTKIGRIVSLQCCIRLTNMGSSTGAVTIRGLPFGGYNGGGTNSPAQVGVLVSEAAMSNFPAGTYGLIWSDANVYCRVNNGAGFTEVSSGNFTNDSEIYYSCTYEIA